MIIRGIKCDLTRKVIKAAADQGWTVELNKNNHLRFVPPCKNLPIVTSSGTPSDVRAVKNLISQLRHSGLIWPPQQQGEAK
jgi:hypothetical protein